MGEVTIRAMDRPGDLGWVLMAHGELYAREYDWATEAVTARIVADHAAHGRPGRDAGWIAELDGRRVGSVLCVREDERTARLRLLLVDPDARGHGAGAALVDTCVARARSAGCAELTLWTNDVLASARRIYEAAGFELVDAERHHSFGQDLVGQHWRLALA